MVTTTTTLPTSRPIDDVCPEERIEPMDEEADMRHALCARGSASSSAFPLTLWAGVDKYWDLLKNFG
jgi:hypothetical protein